MYLTSFLMSLFNSVTFRHETRYGECLFARPDHTLAYYFDIEYVRLIVARAGLEVVELSYATVESVNRKTAVRMKRVFVHGVFRKGLIGTGIDAISDTTHVEKIVSETASYDYDIDTADSCPLQLWLEGDSLAPPCQADMDVIDAILSLCSPTSSSRLYDLGCGDGRICIEATKRFGCYSAGCEIEDSLIERFKYHITRLVDPNLVARIRIIHDDLRNLTLDDATIIVLYLLPESIEEIKPMLVQALERGAVLVCNTWGPKGLTPVQKVDCGFSNNVKLLKYDRSSLFV